MNNSMKRLITEADNVLAMRGNFECRNITERLLAEVKTYAARPLNLIELFSNQQELQTAMDWPGGKGEKGAKEMLLAAMMEIAETLNEINWKPWKAHKLKEVDRLKFATEMTDILQFWANAALCMGFTPCQLASALREKWKVNYQRIADEEVTTK